MTTVGSAADADGRNPRCHRIIRRNSAGTGRETELRTDLVRSRWAAIGAAVAITLGGGGLLTASAESSASASSFVAVSPDRVLDTRQAASTIKTMQPGQTITVALATKVPADATAVAVNVTVANGTAISYLTLFAGATRPDASTINWDGADARANQTIAARARSRPIDPSRSTTHSVRSM